MHTVNDVKKLMTMNHYKHDEISDMPRNQISSRYDLETNDYNAPFGAVDCKVSSSAMKGQTWARCGPTHDDKDLPPFEWKKYTKIVHLGTPMKFDFDWVLTSPLL